MAMAFTRRMTGLERFWLASDRPDRPFAFQQIIEGEGELSEGALRGALARLVEAWPILRGRVGGALWRGGWRPGGLAPSVRVAPGGSWPTSGLLDAPALRGPLSATRGPPIELVLAPDQRTARLVVRTHHALLDGRGAAAVSAELFRALRGEALLGQGPWIPDLALVREAGPAPAPRPEAPALGRGAFPPGVEGPGDPQIVHARARFVAPTAAITARGLLAVRDACRARWADRPDHPAPDAWIASVPVDLRPARPGLERAPGNLTALARVGLPLDLSAPEGLAPALRAAAHPAHAGLSLAFADRLRALPIWALRGLGDARARRLQAEGVTDLSFTFSNVGAMRLEDLRAPGFTPRATGFCPPCTTGIPLLLVLTGFGDTLELNGSAPRALAPGEALPELLRDVVARLGGELV